MNQSMKSLIPWLEITKKAQECRSCGEPTMGHFRDVPMCAECSLDCMRLEELYAVPSSEEKADQAPAVRSFVQRIQLRRWLDVLTILAGLGLWGYLAHKTYVVIVEWVRLGGVQ